MKVKKHCSGLGVNPPRKSAFTIETDPDFFRLHCLAIFSAKRGGGKTVACANLIRLSKERGYYDRVWIITPTYASNREIWDICGAKPEDILEPKRAVLDDVKQLVQTDADDWKQFLNDKREYEKFNNDLGQGKKWGDVQLIEYLERGWLDQTKVKPPQW
eukprot:scaffold24505_cov135-Isochrysis_galbana.AAC.2